MQQLSDNSVSYAGKAGNNVDATCSATVDSKGATMSGTCNIGGQSCAFTATKQ